jgi:hypothetical protein
MSEVVSPLNAPRPVNISYNTHPYAHISARRSTRLHRACSGCRAQQHSRAATSCAQRRRVLRFLFANSPLPSPSPAQSPFAFSSYSPSPVPLSPSRYFRTVGQFAPRMLERVER